MAPEPVTIRRAVAADESVLRELWEEFEQEVPEPPGFVPETWDDEWRDTLDDIEGGGAFLAEDDQGPVGVARIEAPVRGRAHIQLVYVRARGRGRGVAKALLLECADDARARGAQIVSLDVLTVNEPARAIWRRLGFTEYSLAMSSTLDVFAERLSARQPGEQRAAIHVQTDDATSVERALAQFVPRLEEPDVHAGASWITISAAPLDADRDASGRLARELSERLGAVAVELALEGEVVRFRLYERGSMVDEYLSVPTYYGALPKSDELALAANPTVVARLTGADRDAVRRVARTASSPAELPPAAELYAAIERVFGVSP